MTSQDTSSNLSKLSTALLVLNLHKEVEEAGYSAIGRITLNRQIFSLRHEYASEIERVLSEIRLTMHFLSTLSEDTVTDGNVFYSDDLVNYFNGIYLDQLHQLKDKLLQLLHFMLMVTETTPDSLKQELKKPSVSKILKKHGEKLTEIGIYNSVSDWDEGPIKVALAKRTNHHHYVSSLKLNVDVQKVHMSRMMLSPVAQNHLSEYGKQRLKEIGEESFKKFKEELVSKHETTFARINKNIELISAKLIEHYKLPKSPEEYSKYINEHMEFLAALEINNESNLSKVDKKIKDLLDSMMESAKHRFGSELESVYLVGSVGRGAYIPGSSDVNLYFIFNSEQEISYAVESNPIMDVKFFSKKTFFDKSHLKERFICWSDGAVILGKPQEFEVKEFPKPGTLLSILLNSNFAEELESIKNKVKLLHEPSEEVLRAFSLRVAKIMMDFDFGIAISNKPFYSASRIKKLEYVKEMWTSHKRTLIFEQIYQGRILMQADFEVLIDAYMEDTVVQYKKMTDLAKDIELENPI